ncbi:hypothetical protein C8R47DRAFT_604550 [Mycena vitilis]|nr:hypothetical protein C8R47DRAFT_604550 [Mycena vitilis]
MRGSIQSETLRKAERTVRIPIHRSRKARHLLSSGIKHHLFSNNTSAPLHLKRTTQRAAHSSPAISTSIPNPHQGMIDSLSYTWRHRHIYRMSPSPVFTLTLTSEVRSTRTPTASMTKTKTSPSIMSTLARTFKRKAKSTRTAPSRAPAASKWVPLTPAEAHAIMQAEGFAGRYPPFANDQERQKIAPARLLEKKEPQMTLERTTSVEPSYIILSSSL